MVVPAFAANVTLSLDFVEGAFFRNSIDLPQSAESSLMALPANAAQTKRKKKAWHLPEPANK